MSIFTVAVWFGIATVPYPVHFNMVVEPQKHLCYLKQPELLTETKSCADVSIRVVTPSDNGERVKDKVSLICRSASTGVEINLKCN